MTLIEPFTAMANVVAAHLSFHATRIELLATARAAASRDFPEQRLAPRPQALRGEWPQLAAVFA